MNLWDKLKESTSMEDRILCFVKFKCFGVSRLTAIMKEFNLDRPTACVFIKKSPLLFRENEFLKEKVTLINPKSDMLIGNPKDVYKRFIKESISQCENALQIIGTLMYITREKIAYKDFIQAYLDNQHFLSFQCRVGDSRKDKNLFFSNRRKVKKFFLLNEIEGNYE